MKVGRFFAFDRLAFELNGLLRLRFGTPFDPPFKPKCLILLYLYTV